MALISWLALEDRSDWKHTAMCWLKRWQNIVPYLLQILMNISLINYTNTIFKYIINICQAALERLKNWASPSIFNTSLGTQQTLNHAWKTPRLNHIIVAKWRIQSTQNGINRTKPLYTLTSMHTYLVPLGFLFLGLALIKVNWRLPEKGVL